MTISIGTATQSSARDTHVAWLRRREDSRPTLAELLAADRNRETQRPAED
ncbi:hypothetical protein AB0M02_12310 [Actinoplanes sp. NPDC051861]